MNFGKISLREDEKAIYKLRALYSSYGYSQYKVNKFEEYDLYAKNKSFLVSEHLLTFTDTNGKLMALKPDITLSIIKNAVADDKNSYKLYYNENVYRTTDGANGFREIMQTGLEAIGNVDIYTESEVLMLAARSLENVSDEYLIDLSHMRFLVGLLENCGINEEQHPEVLSVLESKNIPALRAFCDACRLDESKKEALCRTASLYLPLDKALEELGEMVEGEKMQSAYDELAAIAGAMRAYGLADRFYMDFSVVNDMSYYDGIIFKGFINGIPDSVLSGGRYDKLLEKFGKNNSALGFAVYLDKLEYFGNTSDEYDIDVLIVYGQQTDLCKLIETAQKYEAEGKSIKLTSAPDDGMRAKETVRL